MIGFELKRILRNRSWKYLLVVLIGSFFYYGMYYNDDVISIATGMSPLTHIQLVESISIMPVLGCCFVLYRIAQEEEPIDSWKVLLTYPIHQQTRVFIKLLILLAFQLPIGCVSVGTYYILTNTLHMDVFYFSMGIQLTYLACYFYYNFVVASGFLKQMGNIQVINVLRYCTPIFLFFCLYNAGDWSWVYVEHFSFIVGCFVLSLAVLFLLLDRTMNRKLFHELVLHKLFGRNIPSQNAILLTQYKGLADKILQFMFIKLDRHTHHYWEVCANVEVSLKESIFYIIVGLCCVIISVDSSVLLFLIVGIACLCSPIVNYFQNIKQMKKIRFE